MNKDRITITFPNGFMDINPDESRQQTILFDRRGSMIRVCGVREERKVFGDLGLLYIPDDHPLAEKLRIILPSFQTSLAFRDIRLSVTVERIDLDLMTCCGRPLRLRYDVKDDDLWIIPEATDIIEDEHGEVHVRLMS